MNLTDKQKRNLAWLIVAIVTIAVNIFLGVSYPLPDLPLGDEIVALGVSHFTGLEVSGAETDALVVNQTSSGDIVEFRDNGTVVWRLADGGRQSFEGSCIDLDADDDTSICADTDDQIDFEIGGLDTAVMKAFPTSTTVTATVNVLEVQGSTPAWTANTNTVNGLDIDLSIGNANTGTHTVRGVMVDTITGDAQVTETAFEVGSGWDTALDANGLEIILDANANTTIAADTDDQIDIEISGADDFQFTANTFSALSGSTIEANNISEETAASGVTIDDELTIAGLLWPSVADETITDGETLTPTVTIYNLDSAGAVTVTLAASGTEGQLLILCGDDANNITVADTNVRTNDGGVQVIGQYDCISWVYIDSEWLELSESNNS